MDISLRIVIPSLLLFVLFIVDIGEGHNSCPELQCGNGPPIRFPFRLKDRQPDQRSGYPGFDLYCSHNNDTVLELPTSVKAFVKNIDYKSQLIEVTDSDNCFPQKILRLNLSSPPFQFKNYLDNYSLFSCTPETYTEYNSYAIPCLNSAATSVLAFSSDSDIDDLPILSCTKMYTVSSVPSDIWSSPSLELTWSGPKCGHCEAKGKICRFENNSTDLKTECFDPDKDKGRRKIITTVSILGSFLLTLVVYALYRVYRYDKTEKENQARIEIFLEDYKALKPTRYSYNDVKRITNQFTEKLGQGAYGTMFKGKFSNEIHVAVKILNSSKGNGEEFINEVGTMGRIHHVNVVCLVGFYADGFRRALVYEFLPNESLEKFISSVDSNRFLGWEKLQDIALGIAKGIEYLHQGCDQRILHFDIKPHNILLDQNFNPKISDFGLAKLCAKDQSAVSMTTARGTMGYIAPEVFSRNFGSVSYNQMFTVLEYCCLKWLEWHPVDRPSMKLVVQMLEGEGDKLIMPPNPFASTNPTRINVSMPARHLNQELVVIPESE
ncbi:hypothetical protein SO802_024467 [Lithocarpus litseifolius]|uniref:non-specific serine/threonine protein kinase n=1 Tax=Lithocarpus litseifolius TaxID=425828 RepID=A0AAW2C965_9ROSI